MVFAGLHDGAVGINGSAPVAHLEEALREVPLGVPVESGVPERARLHQCVESQGRGLEFTDKERIDSILEPLARVLRSDEPPPLAVLPSERRQPTLDLFEVGLDHCNPLDRRARCRRSRRPCGQAQQCQGVGQVPHANRSRSARARMGQRSTRPTARCRRGARTATRRRSADAR